MALKRESPPLFETVFQNHLINDLPAVDTSPSEKMFMGTIEFLEDHDSTASGTFHFL
jgi:hypothetical protein